MMANHSGISSMVGNLIGSCQKNLFQLLYLSFCKTICANISSLSAPNLHGNESTNQKYDSMTQNTYPMRCHDRMKATQGRE